MGKIEFRVRCVCCDFVKVVGKEQTEQPVCDKCFSPMILEKVLVGSDD